MKKKILTVLAPVFALLCCLALASCEEEGTPDTPAPSAPSAPAASSGEDVSGDVEFARGYAFRLDNGVESRLGAVADDFIAALGTPDDVEEAPSCIREGTDRVYEYGGRLTVATEPDAEGRDRITQILFQSDAIALESDAGLLMIGSDVSMADAFFGEPSLVDAGHREYIPDGAFVTITESDGEITGIVLAFPRG